MGFNCITYRLPLVFNALGKDESVLINPPHGFAYITHTSCETFEGDAEIPVVSEEFLGLQFNLGTHIHYRFGKYFGKMHPEYFNIIYMPPGIDCMCTVKKGAFASLSINFPKQYLELVEPYFPSLLKDLFAHAADKVPFALSKYHLHFEGALKHQINAMLTLMIPKGVCRETMLNCIVFDMLLMSLEAIQDAQNKPHPPPTALSRKLEHAHTYLAEHFNRSFSVDLLVELVGLDKHKLRKGFKKTYKTTMHDFVIECRINKAKEYLRNTDFPIGKISRLLGFKTQRYFTTAFKKKIGKSPREERKGHANEIGSDEKK
jgi:AraC-like DNA-binding protein